jgi:metallophosphoesterase (TIGR00282 family)
LRILFVGDIVGKPGRSAFRALIPEIRRRHKVDFAIANCENSAAGFGVLPETARELLEGGADALTSGNHIWKRREIWPYIDREPRLLRPANYPDGAPGRGVGMYVVDGREVAVVNLMGRAHMDPVDCPFRAFDQIHDSLKDRTPIVIVDFHAETTSEKIAFGYYVDGRATAVIGTHTHVTTADEAVLPGGTGFLCDVGMTGPTEGVIGVERAAVIRKFMSGMPVRFEVAAGAAALSAVLIELDAATGRALSLARVREAFMPAETGKP